MQKGRRTFLSGWRKATLVSEARPPWALAEEIFQERCSRCADCIRACPENVLFEGSGQYPAIRFSQTGCTLCGDCVRACQTGALDNTMSAPAFHWKAQTTLACFAQKGVECRICGEICEAQAIRFQLQVGAVAQPKLESDLCNGCGQCLAACPAHAIELVENEVTVSEESGR